ncbi:MAG TPA: HesA/MoeB/ThiF family protein [Candidatus Ignatzschineria merdigallinarum]|uniref:HesA/MoeB/ThiF family protein n=1 Tax=Candidatus Ignatzschineria merdigallinarum TaxID=2838621 RepID=A0A9D1TUL5_9GAMM|nr:HesA/MoeB/ThiF family protein [Candidatus Ignatzschineria merdigallinarum]
MIKIHDGSLTDAELLRYSRHIMLDQFDLEGQNKLNAAHVIVVGCGGLGMAALPLLAGAGIGKITLIDFDIVDITNLHRQTGYQMQDVGLSKVQQAAKHLQALNPNIILEIIEQKVTFSQLETIVAGASCVLDCSDNFSLRKDLNRACLKNQVPLVSGSAVRYEGQLTVFDFREGESACYECLFSGEQADDGNCALFGVFSPVVHIIGVSQAQEALKLILEIGDVATHRIYLYNALTFSWQNFGYRRNPHCQAHDESLY